MLNLEAAGLNQTEATTYEALLTKDKWLPSELAKTVNESRTNMYKVLDSLVELGLAEKFDHNKKLHYRAANPTRLLELAREIRENQEIAERELGLHVQSLISSFVKTHEQPGVRYYQGKDEISDIFDQIANARNEVLFIHTTAGVDDYGFDTMHNLRMRAVKNKIPRRALTPDAELATKDFRITDPKVFLKRTWLGNKDYTAPVEWGMFDDTVYIISYGKEAFGLTIDSPQIAQAFTQLFLLLESTQRLRPDYKKLPRLAGKAGVTS